MNNTKPLRMHKRVIANVIFALTGLLFFTGCVRYQYIIVDSNLHKNENKEFVEETDAVTLKYSFSGMDFPLTINVFNKLPHPLYIDLRNSKVIMNDVPIEGAFEHGNQIDSISPQSSTTIRSINLSDNFIKLSAKDKTINGVIQTTNGPSNVTMHQFNESTSPVFLRSVLTVSNKPDFSSTVLYDHPFWVSGVYQGYDITPSNASSDQFYLKKTSGFSKAMGYTFVAILLVAMAALNPEQQ